MFLALLHDADVKIITEKIYLLSDTICYLGKVIRSR